MPAHRKLTLTDHELRLALARGETPDILAARYGCRPAAVRCRLRQLGTRQWVGTGSPTIDVMTRLAANLETLEALKWACLKQIGTDASGALDLRPPEGEPRGPDPHALLLKTLALIRRYMELAVKVAERVHLVQKGKEFEEEMLRVFQEADPAAAERIRATLNGKRALRTGASPDQPAC
jgi:hypothetical protein